MMNDPKTKIQDKVARLLRRRDSTEFFKGGSWTKNPDEATRFTDALEAARTCAQHGLSNMEITLRMDAEASDLFSTPIR